MADVSPFRELVEDQHPLHHLASNAKTTQMPTLRRDNGGSFKQTKILCAILDQILAMNIARSRATFVRLSQSALEVS